MSQHAAELCTLLVDEIYGELSSRVFAVLLRLGRLSLAELQRSAALSVRQLKHGLAVLIQQHLVLHYTAPDDGVTHYEADWEAAYSLVRSGRVILLAQQRFGDTAAQMTSNLLLLGHATVGDLMDAYTRMLATSGELGKADDGVVQSAGDARSQPTLSELHTAMSSLLGAGYFKVVREEHFRPAADNYNEAERMFQASVSMSSGTGTKAKAELKLRVRKQLEKWRDGSGAMEVNGRASGLKRPSEAYGPDRPGKRRKLAAEHVNGVNGHASDGAPLDASLVVRVDHEKSAVAFRNQELVALAKHKLGAATSQVYAELLQRIGDGLHRCRDGYPDEETPEAGYGTSPVVSTLELCQRLPASIDLGCDITDAPADQIDDAALERSMRGRKRRRLNDGDAEAAGDGDDVDEHGNIAEVVQDVDDAHWDRDYGGEARHSDEAAQATERGKRLGQAKRHLQLLAEDSYHFVKLVGQRGGLGEWTVDFHAVVATLRQLELERIIAARFGPTGQRLVRILSERGKLDEKQMSNVALMRQRDIRTALVGMHEAGFVELQEVPRDNSRAPSRTIYLWFWDADRCRRRVLGDAYKAMARLLQRCAHERRLMRPLLAKADRSDVRGNELVYLTGEERGALQAWREKEERLLAQMARLDRAVGVFRDF